MTVLLRFVIVFFVAAGLGVSASVQAVEIDLFANLSGSSGVPPSGSASTATAEMTYDDVTMMLTWSISEVSPFFDTDVRFAHFHGPATPDQNAGVQLWICDSTGGGPAGAPVCGGAGGIFAAGMAVLTSDQADALLDGLWYINIHTDEFPAGEIRGQVRPVPLPSMGALFGLGLLVMGLARRWRR